MPTGIEIAFGEITLVFFTTMAPAGVFALMIMGAFALRRNLDDRTRAYVDRFTCIPLTIALVGLISSATHLGNPANALYVLAGVGRSPLSNEVVSGVVFFGLAGVYWLTSFSVKPNVRLRRAALVLIEAAGVVFISAIAFAYDAETIATWHTAYVPASLWLNALTAGPVIAVLSLYVAGFVQARRSSWVALLAFSLIACAVNAVVYVAQGFDLRGMENHMTTAVEQAPGYLASVPLFVILAVLGVVVSYCALSREGRGRGRFASKLEGCAEGAARSADARKHVSRATVLWLVSACVLTLAAVFVMRFGFYTIHITVGLGV